MFRRFVRLIANERADLPDLLSLHDLVDDAFVRLFGFFRGGNQVTPWNGIGSGMVLTVDNAAVPPLGHVKFTSGQFVDKAGHLVQHVNTDSECDMTAVAAIVGARVWARRSSPVEVDNDNRIVIAAGAEQGQNIPSRWLYRLQFEATPGAGAPAGVGWAQVCTVSSWHVVGGVNQPNSVSYNAFASVGDYFGIVTDLRSMMTATRNAIAALKGGALAWNDAVPKTITQLAAYAPIGCAKIAGNVFWNGVDWQVTGGFNAVSPAVKNVDGKYTITLATPVPIADVLGQGFANVKPDIAGGPDTWSTFANGVYDGGVNNLIAVQVSAYSSATGFTDLGGAAPIGFAFF